MKWIITLGVALFGACAYGAPNAVYIGFDGAYGQKTNTAAQAIELGARLAIAEINTNGGVLSGRPLELVTTDNQGLSTRGRDNYQELATRKDMVLVLGGKHSPVSVEVIPDVQRLKVPYASVWGSANQITDTVMNDSYMFRLSLKDAWGVEAILKRAGKLSDNGKVCALIPNTVWGRSGEQVIREKISGSKIQLVAVNWYNWGDTDFQAKINDCVTQSAGAMILIANEPEGSLVVKQMAQLPAAKRIPIVSHWGITGGAFAALTGTALNDVDLQVIQTFTFVNNQRPQAQALARKVMLAQKVNAASEIVSPVGVAQAYDMVYLAAAALKKAQSTNGSKIRDALEALPPYDGVIKRYAPAFTKTRHDALDAQQIVFVRLLPNGATAPVK